MAKTDPFAERKPKKKAVQDALLEYIAENGEPAHITTRRTAELANEHYDPEYDHQHVSSKSVARMFSGANPFPELTVSKSGEKVGNANVWAIERDD